MYDGAVNKKSGIIAINLPTTSEYFTASHDSEKESVYPDVTLWTSVDTKAEYERRYPYMPDRLIDNLLKPEAKISVAPWDRIEYDVRRLRFLVDAAFEDRGRCEYDLSQPMRRANS